MNPKIIIKYVLILEFMKAYIIKELNTGKQGSLSDHIEREGYQVTFVDSIDVSVNGLFYVITLKDGEEDLVISGNATIHMVS